MTIKRVTKPSHNPTQEQRAEVRALASFGVPQEQIATYLGIDPKTLRKHYRDELDTSALKVHSRVASFLANAATGAALKQDTGATYRDCLTAAMFYGKTRMGLREKQEIDHTSSDGSLSSSLTEDQIDARLARLIKAIKD